MTLVWKKWKKYMIPSSGWVVDPWSDAKQKARSERKRNWEKVAVFMLADSWVEMMEKRFCSESQ